MAQQKEIIQKKENLWSEVKALFSGGQGTSIFGAFILIVGIGLLFSPVGAVVVVGGVSIFAGFATLVKGLYDHFDEADSYDNVLKPQSKIEQKTNGDSDCQINPLNELDDRGLNNLISRYSGGSRYSEGDESVYTCIKLSEGCDSSCEFEGFEGISFHYNADSYFDKEREHFNEEKLLQDAVQCCRNELKEEWGVLDLKSKGKGGPLSFSEKGRFKQLKSMLRFLKHMGVLKVKAPESPPPLQAEELFDNSGQTMISGMSPTIRRDLKLGRKKSSEVENHDSGVSTKLKG